MNLLIKLLIVLLLIKFLYRILCMFYQYVVMRRQDLARRYGAPNKTYALITGPSRGQGKQFALKLAALGFNLVLIGSPGTHRVAEMAREKGVDAVVIEKDFSRSFVDADFFHEIEAQFKEKDISIVVNNVGYRTGWIGYESMPVEEMKKSIAVGTLTQCVITKFALGHFKARHALQKHSALINITAQCMHNTDLFAWSSEISVPYLSVYEASNAFGFYHSNSVYNEIRDQYRYIDYLTITPGAVITENTREVLGDTLFSVQGSQYVDNILDLLGNLNGVQCAYIGHSMSDTMINLFPWMKSGILRKVGRTIAESFQEQHEQGKKIKTPV